MMRLKFGWLVAALITACGSETPDEVTPAAITPHPAAEALPILDSVPEDGVFPGFDASKGYAEYALRDGHRVVVIAQSDQVPEQDSASTDTLGTHSEALTSNVSANPDTWVRSDTAGTFDFGRSCELRVNNILNGALKNMALLRFPIPTAVQCATITSAKLVMKTGQMPQGLQLVVFAHRIAQPWMVGTTGSTACSSCSLFTGAGANFAMPGFSAAFSPVPVNQPCHSYSWDLTPVVAGGGGWCTAPATNFGVMLAGRNGATTVNFHSNEAAAVADRPKLVIVY